MKGGTGGVNLVPLGPMIIFNHAAKAIEIEDIEARVSELERATANRR
jgi:hypothetical protein